MWDEASASAVGASVRLEWRLNNSSCIMLKPHTHRLCFSINIYNFSFAYRINKHAEQLQVGPFYKYAGSNSFFLAPASQGCKCELLPLMFKCSKAKCLCAVNYTTFLCVPVRGCKDLRRLDCTRDCFVVKFTQLT